MSAATLVTYRRSTRWRDLVWLTRRQHRTALIGTTLLVLAVSALMVVSASISREFVANQLGPLLNLLLEPSALATFITLYSGIVAVFWAAPLFPREFERGTHLVAWGQDVSPRRWLVGKVVPLGVVAVALALVLGTAGWNMATQVGTDVPWARGSRAFHAPYFAAAPLVQVGYVLFGLALGLLAGRLARRTVPAIAITAVGYFATQTVIANVFRPHYQTPVRDTDPLGATRMGPPDGALYVDSGYLDAAGNTVGFGEINCMPSGPTSMQERTQCLQQHGIVSHYTDYQPIDRLATFHVIEFVIFTVLAVALFAATWLLMRRTSRL